MAKYVSNGQGKELVIDRFGGLDRSAPLCGQGGCHELLNFRLLPDGTLQRREGFTPLITFDGSIRGAFYTVRNHAEECYVVADRQVYFLEEGDAGVTSRVIGEIGTDTGKVRFFCHDGAVLLLDGQQIWTLLPSGVSPTIPYTPLYGKDWPTADNTTRAVLEKPSVLTRQVRIRFFDPNNPTSEIKFGDLPVESVDTVLVDGVSKEDWNYHAQERRMSIDRYYEVGAEIEVYVTLSEAFCGDRSWVSCAAHATSIGDAEDARVIFYGGGIPTGHLWMTRATDPEERKRVRAVYPTACMLYVTGLDDLTLGDGIHAITGACRHYDRSLIFTSQGTWMADGVLTDTEKLKLVPVNTLFGCTAQDGFGVVGNTPMTVFGRRVLRWNSKTDERNECNAQGISMPVEPLLFDGFDVQTELFVDPKRDEVWLYRPGQAARILIWQQTEECWTSFGGFAPDGVFALGDRVAFFAGRTVFAFDKQAGCDTLEGGEQTSIEAVYLSRFVDFDQVGRVKRACRGTVVASCKEQALDMVLQDVKGRSRYISLAGDGSEVSVMQRRGYIGRFRYLRVGVRCADVGEVRVHRVGLTVQV